MTVPKSLYLLHELILLTVMLLIRDLTVDKSKQFGLLLVVLKWTFHVLDAKLMASLAGQLGHNLNI